MEEMKRLKSCFWLLIAATSLLGVLAICYWLQTDTQPSVAVGAEDIAPENWTDLLSTTQGNNTALVQVVTSITRASSEDPSIKDSSVNLQKLPWTSLYGKGEEDSYHFFSAYYDNRSSAPERPAVFVMGYSYKDVKPMNFYCVFKYSSGKEICRTTLTASRHPSPCFTPMLGAKAQHFFCHMKPGEEPPVSVKLSTSSGCQPQSTSAENLVCAWEVHWYKSHVTFLMISYSSSK